MPDYLDILAKEAKKTVEEGYYNDTSQTETKAYHVSLKKAIIDCKKAPIISEIKRSSPSEGDLRKEFDLKNIARDMDAGGAVGISVLTEPTFFKGNIEFIPIIREQVKTPILMKDLIVDPVQIESGSRVGANVVLLIHSLFSRGYCKNNIEEMIAYSHSRNLEVLLEVHTRDEFLSALETTADMIGINNRNLETLQVDLKVTKQILTGYDNRNKVIISESGIKNGEDINFLRGCGAQAFLIGTSIMKFSDIRKKISSLVESL